MIRRQNPAGPRAHADPQFLMTKQGRLREPHVARLNDLVDDINATRRDDHAAPWFDPDGGGTAASTLFLLECPGPRSSSHKGSGIISPDNNDGTAENFFRIREEASLARDRVVLWNVVPWYLPSADGRKTRNASRADVADAQPWLHRLLGLLPKLQLVVTMGVAARDGWFRYLTSRTDTPLPPTLAVPHPSPQRLNTDPTARIEIRNAMVRAGGAPPRW